MKNSDTVALVNGDLVIGDQTAADGISVKGAGAVATQLICAGVVSGKDIPVGEFGKIQVYGYHASVKAAAGVTAGGAIKSSATANSVGLGVTADDPVAQLGYAITATASSRIKAWLRCM
jgi:hypothetical protein